jgi:hypothetical protein
MGNHNIQRFDIDKGQCTQIKKKEKLQLQKLTRGIVSASAKDFNVNHQGSKNLVGPVSPMANT